MQSTVHSSMRPLSSTSTQGCVMMYVTCEPRSSLRALVHSAARRTQVSRHYTSIASLPGNGDIVSVTGDRRLSAEDDIGSGSRPPQLDPMLRPARSVPLVPAETDICDSVVRRVGDEPADHRPALARRPDRERCG